MPSLSTIELPFPEAKEFENLLKDYAEIMYGGNASLYGRTGQKQDGVDVIVTLPNGKRICIQCKRWNRKVDNSDIDFMIAEADKFPNSMCKFVIALTEKRDVRLQKYVHEISDSRSKENNFPIDIIFWEDIESVIKRTDSLLRTYYPELYISIGSNITKIRIAITDENIMREIFVELLIKRNVLKILEIDPFAGFEVNLLVNIEYFTTELCELLKQSLMISQKETYVKIAYFLEDFNRFTDYIGMISDPTWVNMFIVNNSIARNEIHLHKQIIEEYKKKALESMSVAGNIRIYY